MGFWIITSANITTCYSIFGYDKEFGVCYQRFGRIDYLHLQNTSFTLKK
jgi:hypothetical protein